MSMSSSKVKVKGLLKGLRYISQIFENEKEQDIQIGFPTDVKHVAHIGWDGPSVNSPSWMNEFKPTTTPGFSSAPLNLAGEAQNKAQDNTVKWISDDSRRKSTRCVNSQGQGRDLPELPKASRRQVMSNPTDSPTREKTKQSRKSKQSQLKESSDGPKSAQQLGSTDLVEGNESPAQNLPEIPKKSRRKKSKENSSGSSKLRSKGQSSDPNLDFESPSKSRNKPMSFEGNEQCERGMSRLS